MLPRGLRKNAVRAAALVPVRSLLELAGVAVFIPLLVIILEKGWMQGDHFLSRLYAWSGMGSPLYFSVLICAGVLLVIILKNICSYHISRFQNRYVLSVYRDFSERLFMKYYENGLSFIKSRNIARTENEINFVAYSFAMNMVQPILSISGEILFVAVLFSILVVYSPVVAVLLPICFVPVLLFYALGVRNRLMDYGQKENRMRQRQSRLVRETFRGYPEIEINNAFGTQMDQFRQGAASLSRIREKMENIMRVPSFLMESAVAAGLAVVVIFSLVTDAGAVMLGVFGVAGLRLLPSVRTIANDWSRIRSNKYSIEVMEAVAGYEGSNFLSDHQVWQTEFSGLRSEGLSFCYEGGKPVLTDVSFGVEPGEFIGIKGTSGVGKTTLLNNLLGLLEPTGGKIFAGGERLTADTRRRWLRMVAYVPQEVFLTDGTIAENITLGSGDVDPVKMHEAVRMSNLSAWVGSLPSGLDTRTGDDGCRISQGQRQRIGIARALYRDSRVIFLDESTSSLDTETERDILECIRKAIVMRGITVVMVSHRLTSLEFCDRVINLSPHGFDGHI